MQSIRVWCVYVCVFPSLENMTVLLHYAYHIIFKLQDEITTLKYLESFGSIPLRSLKKYICIFFTIDMSYLYCLYISIQFKRTA